MNKFDQHLEGLWANINKARKKGTTSSKWKNDPKYRSKLKKAVKKLEEDGHNDVESVNKQIHVAIKALKTIKDQVNTLSDDADLPTWWTNKVAIAIDKLDGMADYLDATVPERVEIDEVRGRVDDSPAIPPETEYEKSAGEHKRKMARKAERQADARQAKREKAIAARKGGRERMKPHELGEGKKKKKAPRKVYDPVSGKYYTPRKMPESVDNINEKKADRCKRRADSVYGKKTSAYKSGAIVRCRQGKIWKKK